MTVNNPPFVNVEVLQLRQSLDYFMAMCDSYEKRLTELEQECEAGYREIDRLNAVVALYEAQYAETHG